MILTLTCFLRMNMNRIWAFIANYGLVVYSGTDHSVLSFHDLSTLGLPAKYEGKQFNSSRIIGQGQMLLASWMGIKKISYDGKGALKIEDQKMPGAGDKEIRLSKLTGKVNFGLQPVPVYSDSAFKTEILLRSTMLTRQIKKNGSVRSIPFFSIAMTTSG